MYNRRRCQTCMVVKNLIICSAIRKFKNLVTKDLPCTRYVPHQMNLITVIELINLNS